VIRLYPERLGLPAPMDSGLRRSRPPHPDLSRATKQIRRPPCADRRILICSVWCPAHACLRPPTQAANPARAMYLPPGSSRGYADGKG
jgi:hypothetical protein